MKIKSIFSSKWVYGNIFAILVAFLAFTCVYLDGVDFAPSVKAGEIATFNMHVRVEGAETVSNTRMVIAFLAPKSWKAAQNTTVTYTSDLDGTSMQTMSLVPAGTVPKNNPGQTWPGALKNRFGFGENVLDDMEWIVFWSDKTYTVNNGDRLKAEVYIKVKVEEQNLKFKPTFFLNHTGDGLSTNGDHFKIFKGDCFEVTDGTGDLIDFCEFHFNSAQPLTATKNDFITISFQGDVAENELTKANKIFLCAKGYTDKGGVLEVCQPEDKTLMKKQFEYGNTYSITLWPASYFNVPEGNELLKIEYSFRNEDGSVEIKEGDLNPFTYSLQCQ